MSLINSDNHQHDIKFEFGKNQTIIVDSGTSFILMPKDERKKLFKYLTELKKFTCNDGLIISCYAFDPGYLKYFPDLMFTINNKTYFIPKEDYVIKNGLIV